jgi:hypothetical protein
MTEENNEKKYMNIDEFVAEYCGPSCDRGGEIDCSCSLDGTCSKSRALKLEITGASGD